MRHIVTVKYVAVFAGVYTGYGVLGGLILTVLGIKSHTLQVFTLALLLASQYVAAKFAKEQRRVFSPVEYWILLLGCLAFINVMQILGAAVTMGDALPTQTTFWVILGIFNVIFAVGMGYLFSAKQMQKLVDRVPATAEVNPKITVLSKIYLSPYLLWPMFLFGWPVLFLGLYAVTFYTSVSPEALTWTTRWIEGGIFTAIGVFLIMFPTFKLGRKQ